VQGANNTISSGTGTALNIQNAEIDVAGVSFHSISSTGGASPAIVLENTGTTGSLIVNGGTISGKRGHGVTLENVAGARLGNMTITSSGARGIRAAAVGALEISANDITGNGSGIDVIGSSTSATCASLFANTLSGVTPLIRVQQLGVGTVDVAQKAPTAGADPLKLDDANGILPASITIIGTVAFDQAPCDLP